MKPYMNLERIEYLSPRYNKTVVVPVGYWSDGATGAVDIDGPHPVQVGPDTVYKSRSWLVHDVLCEYGKWEDNTECTNWQASMVLKDILKSEGRWLRDFWWGMSTWMFGGGKARDNGMW